VSGCETAGRPVDRHASIGKQGDAGGEARRSRCEVKSGFGDFLRLRQPFQGVQAFDESQHIGTSSGRVGDTGRSVRPARQQCVDPNALQAVFGREHLRQSDQPGLARRIGRHSRHADGMTNECAGEDDRTTAALDHRWHLVFGSEKGAGQIGVDRLTPTGE